MYLSSYRGTDSIVLAIPAGGVPVGAVIARELGTPLDVAVVSKITLPWNTEAGYGAVAWDGTVRIRMASRALAGLMETGVTPIVYPSPSAIALTQRNRGQDS